MLTKRKSVIERLKKIISMFIISLILFNLFPEVMHSSAEFVEEMTSEDFLTAIGEMIETYDSNNPDISSSSSKNAEDDFNCRRLIVKTKQGETLATDYSATDRIDGPDSVYILQYTSQEATEYAFEQFSTASYVDFVEPDYYFDFPYETTDTGESDSRGEVDKLSGSDIVKTLEVIKKLSDNGVRFHEVRVAVFDSGITVKHKYMDEKRYPERHNIYGNNKRTNDDHGHGTAVAYTIEKNTPDSVKIIPYKVIHSYSLVNYLETATAILAASENDIKIINMSYTVPQKYNEQYLKNIKKAYNDYGTLIVIAAGNTGENIDETDIYPKCSDYVITVAATNRTTSVNSLMPLQTEKYVTNYGECVDISAPGEDIKCAYILGGEFYQTGTSFAAPFVTSALAILMSSKPDLTLMQCESILKNNVTVPNGWIADSYGTGVVNAKKMFENSLSDSPKISLSSSGAVITAENNAIIYYTTDGSTPIAGVSHVYTSPIDTLHSNIKTICAVACENGKLPSCTVEAKLKWEDKINITYKQKVKIELATARNCRYCYSTDESVATVDEDGYVTGVSRGKAKVVVETFDNRRCEYLVTVRYSLSQWIIILFLFGFIWYI